MRERLAGLVTRRAGSPRDEAAEKLRLTEAALQEAHREREVRGLIL